MPCSFCRSRSHTINYCNSPQIQEITSKLRDEAIECVKQCNYQKFSTSVTLLTINKIKVACMFWHNTISPELYSNLLEQTNTIPEIRATFTRDKYRHIAKWLYLTDAFDNMNEEDLVRDNGIYGVECFKERIEYLRRIVIQGMSEYDSYEVYLDFILNDRQRYLNEVSLSHNVQFNLVESYGFSRPYYSMRQPDPQVTKKFSFLIEHEKADSEEEDSIQSCPVCYDDHTKSSCVMLGCNHSLCVTCFVGYLKSRNSDIHCSICRADILNAKIYNSAQMDTLKAFVQDNQEEEEEEAEESSIIQDGPRGGWWLYV